jgi:hypothetical protein
MNIPGQLTQERDFVAEKKQHTGQQKQKPGPDQQLAD